MKPHPPLNGGGARKAAAVVSSVAAAVILGFSAGVANAGLANDIEIYASPQDTAEKFNEQTNPWGYWFTDGTQGVKDTAANTEVITDKNVEFRDLNGAKVDGQTVQSMRIADGTTAVINGWAEFAKHTDDDGAELFLGRPGTDSSTGSTSMAALVVKGDAKTNDDPNLVFNTGYIDVVNADALIASKGVTFNLKSAIAVGVSEAWGGSYSNRIQKNGTERLLLGNFINEYSGITSAGLDSWWNTNKEKFDNLAAIDSLQDGDFVIHLKDFPIKMNDQSYLSANKTAYQHDGRIFVIGGDNGSFSLSDTASLRASELYLANAAAIDVTNGSTAYIGTITKGTSGYALTIGGTGFKLGSQEVGANGLINVEGSTQISGGEFYFLGETTTTDLGGNPSTSYNSNNTGIKTTSGDIHSSGATISLDVAKLVSAGQIILDDTSLTLSGADTGTQNISQNVWSVFNLRQLATLQANDAITVTNSNILTGGSTGFYSVNDSIIFDAGTTLTYKTDWSGTYRYNGLVFYAQKDISVLGQSSEINGLFHATANEGDIKILSKKIKIHPDGRLDEMYLLHAKEGSITLAAFGDDGSLELVQRAHDVSYSNVIAGYGETIRFHGDTGVNLATAPISFGGKVASPQTDNSLKHKEDTVKVTALKGKITIGASTDIHTDLFSYTGSNQTQTAGGYGTIDIYGQQVSANENGVLKEEAFTDVDVDIDGKLYASTINIGQGIGSSLVDISGKIFAHDNTFADDGYSINVIAGSNGLSLDGATIAYGDRDGGETVLESKGGNITLKNATIHDNGALIQSSVDTSDETASDADQKAGTLTIKLTDASDTEAILTEAERIISIASTTINDDIITINAAGGSVQLTGGSTVVADNTTENEANNGLTVIGSSVSLADGSHFGNVDADGNMVGAKVDVQTSNLALDGTSYITSAGDVSIESNNGGKLTIAMDQTDAKDEASWIKGNNVTIGDGTGAVDLTGGSVSVADNGTLSVKLGSGNSSFTGVSVGGDNQKVKITESQNANANLTINNGTDKPSVIDGETVDITVGGTVSVAGVQNKEDADLNSHIQGGNITINAGKVDLGDDGWIQGETNLKITAPELALNNGAHIGTGKKDSTSEGSNVTITSDKVRVGDDSFITSADEVSIGSESGRLDLTMTADAEDAEEGWIKGNKVNISGNGIGITDGEILSTGKDGDDITISSTGNINFTNTDINAGDKGDVIINTGRGTEGSITGSNISGNTINFGGKPDQSDLDLGKIVVNGGTNISAGSNEGSSGQINIGTGVNVIVSNDGSLTANKGTDDEITSPVINVNGGKLTIDQGGEVTSEGNVDVTGGGSIDFTGTADPSTGVDAGKLVAGGALNVGGGNDGGSVNVGAGQTGVIIAGNDEDGANVNIGNGGAINIGKDEDGSNQGSLIIGTGDGALPEPGENGGLAVGDNTTVNVNDGGTLVAGSITGTNNGSTEGIGNVHLNGGTLVTDKDTVLGGLDSGLITNNTGVDSTFDMGNSSFTKEEIDGLRDKIGDNSTLIIGTVDGFTEGESISKDDLENLYGNAVANGAVIDTTNGGEDNDNTLTQGGGSQIQVSGNGDAGDNVGDGNLHIEKGENNGHVVITGSNSNAEQDLITGGTNSEGGHDIILGDGAHLTFGDSNSAGGVLDGNILLENGNAGADNVFDVVGGDFNVKGKVDIGSADIVIDGNSNQNGASLTVDGNVTGGSLTMQGTNASMDVGGELNIAGDANLSATGNGGHLITGEAMSVGGHLNVGEGMSIGSEDDSTDTSLTASGITMTGDGSIDRGPVTSNGDLVMKDESSLTASATEGNDTALDVNGNASIGVKDEGETGEHNPTLNVNGNGDISGNLNQGGGQINVADGGLTVGGDLDQDSGFITIDDLLDINGMLDQEKDGTIVAEGGMDVAGSAEIGGNVTVGVAGGDDAKASFGNGLTVQPGGSFTNNSAMDGLNEDGSNADTTVTGDLIVGEVGADETASATLGDATVSGKTEINNGNVTTGAFDAEGNVNLGENGHLSATGDIDIGSGTDGNLVVDGGSTVSASANDASGDKGDITVAGSAMVTNGSVSAEGALGIGSGLVVGNEDNKGSAQVASDSLGVTGDTVIWGNGNVEITQEAILSGGLTVNGGDFTAGGDLTVKGDAKINSGTVTAADSSSITGDLVVGSANAGEGEEAIFNAGSAPEFAGNVTVEGNGQLNFSGATDFDAGKNFIVKDNGSVNEGIDLPDGTSITVNGGFGLGTNGFINAGDSFSLGTGSSLLKPDGSELGEDPIKGFISASEEINFGSHEITFTGGEDAEGNPILAGTNAHKITGNVTYEDGAKHIFEKLDGHDDAGEVQGVVTIGKGGTLTTNAGFEGDSEKANLFVDGTITLVDETSAIVIGDIGSTTTVPQPGVAFGSGAALTIDGTNFVGGNSLFATADGNATNIVVGGLQEGEKVSISMDNMSLANGETLIFGNMDEDTANQFEFDSNNILQDYFLNVTDGTGYLGMNLKGADQFGVSNDVSDVVSAVLGNKNENSQKQDLINQVFTEGTGWLTSTTDADGNPVYMVTEAGQQRIQDVLSLPIAAGAFNIAYDAMSEMNQTMANRMAEPITAHSVSVWADVIATYNSADELFGNSGYSADIYAAVMGADVGITEDWIAGVAFTIGQGDADGEGDTMGIQNDADFYGFSVYTAKNVGQLRFSGDMGYLKLKNDISTDVNYGGKGDTDVITVGARMDMTVHQGEQFDVTPHFGIRYANFNIDTINGTATNDINVVEVPLGVTVKGKTSMNGWKVAPMVDVSVVPQFGDKKAKIWNSGVAYEQDVLDSALVKTSVGVSAQKGNFTFGLNYRLGAGNDERQNHSFNANIRYQF